MDVEYIDNWNINILSQHYCGRSTSVGFVFLQALGLLFWHKYSIEKAVEDLPNFCPLQGTEFCINYTVSMFIYSWETEKGGSNYVKVKEKLFW